MFSDQNKRSWNRLNIRLALWQSALLFVIVASVLWVSYVTLRARVEEQDREAVVFRLNQYVSEYHRGGLEAAVSLAALRKGQAQNTFFIRIGGTENQTLYVRDPEAWVEFFPEQLDGLPIPDAGKVEWTNLRSETGFSLRLAGTRLEGGEVLQVGKTTEGSSTVFTQFRYVAIILMAIAIPASIAGGAFIAGRMLRPLRTLTRTVREIEKTAQYTMRTPESGSGDELDELAQVFNSAMSRIERLLGTMRESLDNVAHDLRTPMTRLRNRAQHCLENGEDSDAQREALIECLEESDHVLEVLRVLMDIAEAEAGLKQERAIEVEIGGVTASVCDLYSEVAEDRRILVEQEMEPGGVVKSDPVLLRRVIANLLDNALKYTAPGGKVHIRSRRIDGMVELEMSDTGAGISADDLPKVWERLFRGDRSRSERGLGLGLSFVKAIVEANEGSVQVESRVQQGSVFTIRWPAADRVT